MTVCGSRKYAHTFSNKGEGREGSENRFFKKNWEGNYEAFCRGRVTIWDIFWVNTVAIIFSIKLRLNHYTNSGVAVGAVSLLHFHSQNNFLSQLISGHVQHSYLQLVYCYSLVLGHCHTSQEYQDLLQSF